MASLYLLDIALANGWAMTWLQWRNDPSLLHIRSVGDKLRATLQGLQLVRLTGELGLLLSGTYWLTRQPSRLRVTPTRLAERYLIVLAAAHLLLSRTNAIHYALQFVPFSCVFVVLRLTEWLPKQPPPNRILGWRLLLGTYLLAGAFRGGQLVYANVTTPGITSLNAHMAGLIGQQGAKVLAPLDFFYEQIGHYRLEGIDRHMGGFFKPLHPGNLFSHERLFQMAEREGFVAVITYDGKGEAAPLENTHPLPDSLARFGPFRRVYQDRWNSLYVKAPFGG
jgi:hypothetical protein